MTNDRMVDMIERANDANPWCSCGLHTRPVGREGAVWLECVSFTKPKEGRLARFLAALTAHTHVRERIVDYPSLTTSAFGGR
jgi:hypothetical protein